MRTWLWTLLLVVVAVALAVVLRAHPGNVLLMITPWRIEMSLTLAVLLLLASFVALYIVLRLVGWLLAIPERMRAWQGRRAQARDQELIEQGWIGLLEGRYVTAEKDFSKLHGQTRSATRRVLAALSAARAAHQMGEFARRDRLLDDSRDNAGTDLRLQEATAAVAADMLLDQGQAQRALDLLEPLQDGGVRHLHTLRLLLRAEKALDHHERVFTLARSLLRRHAIEKSDALQLIDQSGAARLRAGMTGGDGWRGIWKEMKSEERVLPNIALAAAAAFDGAGESAEAGRILEAAIVGKFNPTLVTAYAHCEADQVPRRLAKAETWLQQRQGDANLLTALGLLCLNGQLWGQAERYLERSLSRNNDPQTHALLGRLYDRLNRSDDAMRHWRLATEARMALPVLAVDTLLPAADTQADPDTYRTDVGGTYAPPPVDTQVAAEPEPERAMPVPPAVDYVIEPEARELVERSKPVDEPQASVPARSSVDIEDYFDSAPPPAAAFELPESRTAEDEAKAPAKAIPGRHSQTDNKG
jgi:HemY protein